MWKCLTLIFITITTTHLMAQDYEYPPTSEEEYYEGEQINPEAFPEGLYEELERQEDFGYYPEEQVYDDYYLEEEEAYPEEDLGWEYDQNLEEPYVE